MNEIENLLKAREILERSTPLHPHDCGKLCGAACCNGDSETGMLLFPHEDELYKGKEGFTLIETDANMGFPLLVCGGTCDRCDRPLACRMYPFFPVISDDSSVKIIRDIRGMNSCPIVSETMKPDPVFARNLRKAARYLMRSEIYRNYLSFIYSQIAEIAELNNKLLG